MTKAGSLYVCFNHLGKGNEIIEWIYAVVIVVIAVYMVVNYSL